MGESGRVNHHAAAEAEEGLQSELARAACPRAIDAIERAAERLRLAHVGATDIHVRARAGELLVGTGALADQRPHLVPAEEQPGDRVPPHESVRAGHGYAHRLTALVLRGRSSSTLPARVNPSARGQNR